MKISVRRAPGLLANLLGASVLLVATGAHAQSAADSLDDLQFSDTLHTLALPDVSLYSPKTGIFIQDGSYSPMGGPPMTVVGIEKPDASGGTVNDQCFLMYDDPGIAHQKIAAAKDSYRIVTSHELTNPDLMVKLRGLLQGLPENQTGALPDEIRSLTLQILHDNHDCQDRLYSLNKPIPSYVTATKPG